MKNLLADRRGGWVSDGRLCRSRVAWVGIFERFMGEKNWGRLKSSSSLYTVFHSVIYNSVAVLYCWPCHSSEGSRCEREAGFELWTLHYSYLHSTLSSFWHLCEFTCLRNVKHKWVRNALVQGMSHINEWECTCILNVTYLSEKCTCTV